MTYVPSLQTRLIAGLIAAVVLALSISAATESAKASPYDRNGMWIWYVSSSHDGDLSRIIKRAKKSDIGTLYIKSGDGTDTWSQFNKPLVNRLHRAGLKVCGWQFVYGDHPGKEAKVSAAAKNRGADCFVIDAESDYESNYSGADRYIRALRKRVGSRFPISLSSFPYTDYHPSFPYSVFLGPGAATANLPQIYWKAIGDTVREAVEHTWYWNDIYERTIFPVGQTYENPRAKELTHFRRYMDNYRVAPSWWSWQETSNSSWSTLGLDLAGGFNSYQRVTDKPTMEAGDRGDQVVWLQQHLVAWGADMEITGIYGGGTKRAIQKFQRDRGLKVDGVTGTQTWNRLLKITPVRVNWSGARGRRVAGASSAPSEPLSANTPSVRNEIAGAKKPGQP